MYVKSLTLRGFKSFASATTLRLEPGITCIVGPNGSGKSNVVDALAWVMGEQGAKSLRGGKMEDVIFAGTAGRAPLGRAEVALTIDNTDGALPIDYTEVTIARTMFRNGGSEYAINGTSCRLLDVQELLSDSGIGREMHVIVGQGQLDTVLRATPEERRGFIEEAAGVLKHRKRKERALRKLETMEANLTRVNDLTGEIRRQLGPLGRQAEAARKAAVIQADARDARLRLLADDLVQLTGDARAGGRRRDRPDRPPHRGRGGPGRPSATGSPRLEAEAQEAAPRARPSPGALVRPAVPARQAGPPPSPWPPSGCACSPRTSRRRRPPGATPRSCARRPPRLREQEEALLAEVPRAKDELAGRRRRAAPRPRRRYAAEQQRLQRLARAAADRREGLAKLAGQVGARRSRIEAGEAEIGRLRGVVEQRWRAPPTPSRSSPTSRPPSPSRRRARRGWTPPTRRPPPPSTRLEAEVERLREAGARRRARPHQRRAPGSRPSSSACAARTAPPPARRGRPPTRHRRLGRLAAPGLRRPRGRRRGGAGLGRRCARGRVRRARRPRPRHRCATTTPAALRSSSGRPRRPQRPGQLARPRRRRPSGPATSSSAPDAVRPAVEQLLERVALVPDAAQAAALVGARRGHHRGDRRRRRLRPGLGARRQQRRRPA